MTTLGNMSVASAGRRIRDERTKAGMSLARLADVTGLSKTYLIRLETNEKSNPSLGVLHQIAEALDITVADLLDRPKMKVEGEYEVLPSLQAFADEADLSQAEIQTLASIRWRDGDEPQTPERWRYVYDSLNLSKEIDRRK